jgi:hypothetical protein
MFVHILSACRSGRDVQIVAEAALTEGVLCIVIVVLHTEMSV